MAKLPRAIGFSLILASSAAMAAPSTKPDAGNQDQKYCLTFQSDTGSHLSRTECRTKNEWRQLGVDVDELSSKGGNPGGLA
ncbi:MAG TPA: hypothetical protein VK192_06830 [Sphingomicrobium sp.]|jgi:hypothetical protein|nr:hypothetical protein [Sphingomicrobium sp.]